MTSRLLSEFGMLPVLLVLCVVLSALTYEEHHPVGAAGGEELARDIVGQTPAGARVLIVVRGGEQDAAFANALAAALNESGRFVVATAEGPAAARTALTEAARDAGRLDVIAATEATSRWDVFDGLDSRVPSLAGVRVLAPHGYHWPAFLTATNLRNVADQIAIIAIIAIGMTMVIITGGIDLSVGSLLALSAVLATLLIRDFAGGESATTAGLVACGVAAVVLSGLVGAVNGVLVTRFALAPFIVTLGVMQIARGAALRLADGQSINQVPPSFTWLGQGTTLFGVPNAVVLMLVLYLAGHVVMARTTLGRYLYAVGGNAEAARLSGVPVRRVVAFAYVLSALLAGLGGVITASQLGGGSPIYGRDYELSVIAAVVVGGTSLSGGEGTIFGTLVGALLIGVIHNGMNLMQLSSYDQMIVLGAVIVAAVLLDRMKRYGRRLR
jgi:ribose transport system permease protein